MPLIAIIPAAVAVATVVTAGATIFTVAAAVGAVVAAVGYFTKIKELQIAGTVLGVVGGIGALASSAGLFGAGGASLFGETAAGAAGASAAAGEATSGVMPVTNFATETGAAVTAGGEATSTAGTTAGQVLTDVTPYANTAYDTATTTADAAFIGAGETGTQVAEAGAGATGAEAAAQASAEAASVAPPAEVDIIEMVAGRAGAEAGAEAGIAEAADSFADQVVASTDVAGATPAEEAMQAARTDFMPEAPDELLARSQPESLIDSQASFDPTDPSRVPLSESDYASSAYPDVKDTRASYGAEVTDADGNVIQGDSVRNEQIAQSVDKTGTTGQPEPKTPTPAKSTTTDTPKWAVTKDPKALPPGVEQQPVPSNTDLINAPAIAKGNTIEQKGFFDNILAAAEKNSTLTLGLLMGATSFISGAFKGSSGGETAEQSAELAAKYEAEARANHAAAALDEIRAENMRTPWVNAREVGPLTSAVPGSEAPPQRDTTRPEPSAAPPPIPRPAPQRPAQNPFQMAAAPSPRGLIDSAGGVTGRPAANIGGISGRVT